MNYQFVVISLPLCLMYLREKREEGGCGSANFWMLLLLLSIPALYRNEDDNANHIKHQNISQEP